MKKDWRNKENNEKNMIKIIKEYQRKNKNYKKVLEKKIKTMKTDWKIIK